MPTLVIDTSGAFSTIVVIKRGKIAGLSRLHAQPATYLHEQINVLLKDLHVSFAELTDIACLIGPGGWTGLNIGVTAAKTIAQVLGIPLVPVSTLDALVADRSWNEGPVCGLLGAGRRRAYWAWYNTGTNGLVALPSGRSRVAEFAEWLSDLGSKSGRPLVIEYGRSLQDQLRPFLGAVALESHDMIAPRGIRAALEHSRSSLLRGPEILALAPNYMQSSLAERDAGVSC